MISVGIVAHYSREAAADKLARFVQADVVAMDEGGLGCNANHLAAWELIADPSPWHKPTTKSWGVVLEDDAVPVGMFRAELKMALEHAPSDIVSLYLGRGRPEHWQEPISHVMAADVSWLVATDMLHAVGYAIRWPLLPSFFRWVPEIMATRSPELPIDEAITVWAQTIETQIAYSRPSLVNHADGPPVIRDADRTTRIAYLDPSPDLPSGDERIAWLFGSKQAVSHKGWDSTSRIITPPTVLGSITA